MARKGQKLINFHGTVKANLESAKAQLNLGEIAVVHNEEEPLLAIRVSSDTTDSIAYFVDSGATASAVKKVADSVTSEVEARTSADNVLDARIDKLEAVSGLTSSALQNITAVGDTFVKANVTGTGTTKNIAITTVTGTVADNGEGLATAKDVKTYVDGQVSAKNVTATGDTYVKATASGNKVTIATNAVTDLSTGATTTGKVADAKAVKDYVDAREEAITTAYTAADTQIKSSVTALDGKVTTLIGSDAGKSARAIAAEEAKKEVLTVTSDAPEAFDTLKEVADWIKQSGGDAADLVAKIGVLSGHVEDLQEADTVITGALSGISGVAVTALQSIEKGTDGEFVTTTVGAKSANKQKVSVSVKIQEVATASSAATGIAEASDVKSYVDKQVSDKNVDAEGDTYITATASGNKVTVKANAVTDLSTGATKTGKIADAKAVKDYVDTTKSDITTAYTAADKVVEGKITTLSGNVHTALTAVKATADSAVQEIVATGDTFVNVSVSGASTTKGITIKATTGTVAGNSSALAVASDVKTYVDTQITSATGDFLNDVKVTNLSGVTASKSGRVVTIDFADMVIDCGEF